MIFEVFNTDSKHGCWLQLQLGALGSPLDQVFSCWIVRNSSKGGERWVLDERVFAAAATNHRYKSI